MSEPSSANPFNRPQFSFMQACMPVPSPASSTYLTKRQESESDGSVRYTITGVHVVLEKGDPNRLWETLHIDRTTQRLDPAAPRNATKSVAIYCDRLEVHGELCIPEAEVTVHAREIVWADRAAAINVSPLPWAVDKAADAQGATPGRDGAHGRNAGTLRVFAAQVSPVNDGISRLLAQGGNGQHPGLGLDGENGESRQSWKEFCNTYVDSGISKSHAKTTFPISAVCIEAKWKWSFKTIDTRTHGVNSFPTNGKNAVAGGKPGNAGDGGALVTNLPDLAASLRNQAGNSGTKPRNYSGGEGGSPRHSAKYRVFMWHNLTGTDKADVETTLLAECHTSDGLPAESPGPDKARGTSPAPQVMAARNAWLHPLGAQCALTYMRDLFLADARDELLALVSAYEQAAAATPGNEHWKGTQGVAMLTSVRAELGAMLQKLHGLLDAYGNPAGYTPFLSLQGTAQLYNEETERSLRCLLLTRWMCARDREVRDSAKALAEAVTMLNADTSHAATRIAGAESRLHDAEERIRVVRTELTSLGNELEALRNTLLSQAQDTEDRKAKIKFAIHMASALCQVIPVGQPALGAVGSLASVASGLVDGAGGKAVPDTLSEMGKVLDKASAASKEARKVREAAEKEAKDLTADQKAARAKADTWGQVGAGLGTALGEVAKGIQALQVPQSAVEAELQRLEAASTEWARLTKRIREVNERKTGLLTTIVDALQEVGDCYARISGNGAAVVTLGQDMGKAHGKVDDASMSFIRQMDQRARLTLTRYVYLMVKAYQTTVLEPIELEWKCSDLTDRILNLIGPDGGFDAASLDTYTRALMPVYEENLNIVRRKLLDEFDFNETTFNLQLCLSRGQTPLDMQQLDHAGRTVVDPLEYGLILPDQQMARIARMNLKGVEFDPAGPPLPEHVNMVISVQPGNNGVMRKGERLCALFSDHPLKWTWTCLPDGTVKAGERSAAAEDMLNLVLGGGSEKIRQKVALPPAWSKLFIKVAYSPMLSQEKRPRLQRLMFDFVCDSSPAPEHQSVLTVRSVGSNGGAVFGCSRDMGSRGDGFGTLVRIYPKGASVTLTVPSVVGAAAFDSWDIVGNSIDWKDVRQTEVTVPLDDHVLALCNWTKTDMHEGVFMLHEVLELQDLHNLSHAERSTETFALLHEAIVAKENALRDLPVYHGPFLESPVVTMVPDLSEADVLESAPDDWQKVNYKGIVGWVHTVPAAARRAG